MHLKAIEIQGFKSFAEKTRLEFLPPTKDKRLITAIVGPNGSGKSNISDAIRWVMGEQKMKLLRGKKSDDVIFAGSVGRARQGMASVTIEIDNHDRSVDFDYDDLVLTRRIFRTGESEYLINGAPSRLFDVQILLAKAQFGQGSYSLIGQGMIDRLVLQSPAERKIFFDEAAGIKEFMIKRHQAALKLDRTEHHLKEAELLFDEIAPRLRSLEKQMKKRDERLSLEVELKDAAEQYFYTLGQAQTARLNHCRLSSSNFSKIKEQKEVALQAVQIELATLASLPSQSERFSVLENKLSTLRSLINELVRERAAFEGRLEIGYKNQGRQDLAWLEQKISTLNQSVFEKKSELSNLSLSFDQAEKAVFAARERLDFLNLEISRLESTLSEALRKKDTAAREEEVLSAIGFSAVRSVLEERESFGGVFGTVSSLGRVEREHQTALDVAAGAHLSSLVVKDDTVASRAIEFLRARSLGVATFLPLNKIRPRPTEVSGDLLSRPGVVGRAIDLIDFDDEYYDIFAFVFGSTLVVEDLASARAIGVGSVRMVTLAGDLLESSGAMRGGYRKERTGLSFAGMEKSTSLRDDWQARISDLEVKIRSLREEKKIMEDQAPSLMSTVEGLKARRSVLQSVFEGEELELSNLKAEREAIGLSPEALSSVLSDIKIKIEDINTKIKNKESEVLVAETEMGDFHKQEEERKQKIFALQDQMQSAQNSLNIVVSEHNTVLVEIARLEAKIEDLNNECATELQVGLDSLLARRAGSAIVDDLPGLQKKMEKIKYQLTLIGGIDDEVVKEFEETKTRYDGLSSELTDLRRAKKDLLELLSELDEVMRKKRVKAFREIKREFARYFAVLFGGGEAELVEVYAEEGEEGKNEQTTNPEGSEEETFLADEDVPSASIHQPRRTGDKVLVGIEITACPPGKKIAHLQSLSGGERTMTAIALISAIIKTNPSPFVFLDEVEAALDEANTVRFTNILKELSENSQCLLITHNRATMHAADALYGVTMGQDGVSQIVSVKLGEAVATVG